MYNRDTVCHHTAASCPTLQDAVSSVRSSSGWIHSVNNRDTALRYKFGREWGGGGGGGGGALSGGRQTLIHHLYNIIYFIRFNVDVRLRLSVSCFTKGGGSHCHFIILVLHHMTRDGLGSEGQGVPVIYSHTLVSVFR